MQPPEGNGQCAASATPLIADVEIPIDLRLYPLEVVYRTCYSFTDRAYLWLHSLGPDKIVVAITRKCPLNIEELVGEFGNALIDFGLRRQVTVETQTVRTVLVNAALGGINRTCTSF